MNIKNKEIYPDCLYITRTVEVGGLTKSQLMQKMQQHSILMNELGEMLFKDDYFTTSAKTFSLKTVELTVRDLGLPKGDTLTKIFERANHLGLELCPLELGPYLRLEYLDQPEGKPSRKHQAPNGSITVASETLIDEEDFPKGSISDVLKETYGCVDTLLMSSTCGTQMITLSLLKQSDPVCGKA